MTRRKARISAGLLMYRLGKIGLEVFLAHPGGPFFMNRNDGYWSIPKGEPNEGEDLLKTAEREFEEEVGLRPTGPYLELGSIQQKGGKWVYAWAFEGDWPEGQPHQCNTFQMEWPSDSGKILSFPEIDKVCFFPLDEARQKLKGTQHPFLDRLAEKLRK